jgi:hypothetical protein
MIINVTQEDIDNGVPGSTVCCPVAIAARRDIPRVERLTVGPYAMVLTTTKSKFFFFEEWDRLAESIPLSKRVTKFIRNFDIGGKTDPYVKPFSFELEL